MIAALLLAAAVPTAVDAQRSGQLTAFPDAPVTAIEAERAFALDAQRIGQWTAFRKWADRDAVIFTPQAAWAQTALPKKDPARAIKWHPAHSFISCDGRIAVNTGPWFKQDGSVGGYFTTVWQQAKTQWRWVYDGGGSLGGSLADRRTPQVHRASCTRRAPGPPIPPPPPLTKHEAHTTPEDNGRGQSADKTLGWDWKVDKDGGRNFRVFLWSGVRYAEVLHNQVPPP
jgi:hypothetical protein